MLAREGVELLFHTANGPAIQGCIHLHKQRKQISQFVFMGNVESHYFCRNTAASIVTFPQKKRKNFTEEYSFLYTRSSAEMFCSVIQLLCANSLCCER